MVYISECEKHALRPTIIINRKGQTMFLCALFLPFISSIYYDPQGFNRFINWNLEVFKFRMTLRFMFASSLLAIERICYTIIWLYPHKVEIYITKFKGKGLNKNTDTIIDSIYKLFLINKVFQLLGYVLIYSLHPSINFQNMTLFQFVVGSIFSLVGQFLNVSTYLAIGKVGVYYGYKFGFHVPWCNGFPFNVITSHPQYLGSTLTSYGLIFMTMTEHHSKEGWLMLGHMQALQYLYMAYVEHNL